jgi:glycosyltransferase involved in cell wall biosynthesis
VNQSLPSAIQVAQRNGGPIGIIIPACDEEACIGAVLDELLGIADSEKFVVLVGVNASSDRTAKIARDREVLVAETTRRGYGHGCVAAIDLAKRTIPSLRAYIFFAGDGASDPRDLASLVSAYEAGFNLVLGARTGRLSNWGTMKFSHVLANFALALWCGLLTGRRFKDLGPLRLIDKELYERLALREMTFGWTIEAQIGAARYGATIREVPVRERRRLAGQQKVSGVTCRQTFVIGCRILAAGYRAYRRFRKSARFQDRAGREALVPQQRGA